ncbi:MAG: ZIP family metal transporter [bacterium]
MNTQIESYLAVLVVSLSSLAIILIFNKLKIFSNYLSYLIALASGTLLADVLLHILPEIGIDKNQNLTLVILFALILYFFLESVLQIRHSHHENNEHTSLRYGLVSSDVIHNFIDGVAIAASFSVSFPLGIATTIAIIFHEIPKEVGSIAVLLKSGLNISNSIRLNLLTAVFALLGVLFVNILPKGFEPYLLAFTAGNFLYISLADLLPEIHSESTTRKTAIISFLMFMVGIALMFSLKFIT